MLFRSDTLALVRTAQEAGAPIQLVETTVAINKARKRAMADRIVAIAGGDLKGKTVALLGLTFKPNTDDMRDAPALDIVPTLQKAGARVQAFDPEGMDEAAKLLTDVTFCKNPYECVQGADVLAIITEWDQFRALDLKRMKTAMKTPLIVDLRNVYRPDEMREHGFTYVSIGRP